MSMHIVSLRIAIQEIEVLRRAVSSFTGGYSKRDAGHLERDLHNIKSMATVKVKIGLCDLSIQHRRLDSKRVKAQ